MHGGSKAGGGGYGLRSEFPEYYEEGTELDKELDACEAFFFDPPLGSGLRGPMAPETLSIKLDAVQEFWGYCKKHEGREPSFELLRDTTMVARFLSFRKARKNVVNTMLICILDLRALLPFAFFAGACPGLSALPQPEVDAVKAWYKEVTARIGVEAQKPGSKRKSPSGVSLAGLWEALEASWLSFKAGFEVGACMAAWHQVFSNSPQHGRSETLGCLLLQDNGKEWSEGLAQSCLSVGLGLVVSGWGQPPLRKISARVMHKFDKTKTTCMHEKCRWVAVGKQQGLVS